MLPTIDISLIGILLAVWNVIKVIWDYTTQAFNWITQRALAVFLGSKFWATAFFIVIAVSLLSLLSTLLTAVSNHLLSLIVPSVNNIPSSVVKLACFLFPIHEATDLILFCLSSYGVYFLVINLDFSRRALQRIFTFVSQSWKT